MRTAPHNPVPPAPAEWISLAGSAYSLPIYEMHRRGDTRRYFLRDTLLPPYKKPLLPGAALQPKSHRLLSQLKISGSYLAIALLQAQQSLLAAKAWTVFSVELPAPAIDGEKRFARWWDNGLQSPCLAAAFELRTSGTSHFYFSLDLKQIHPRRRQPPESFSPMQLLTAACAARFYNEAVQGLFDIGLVVFPYNRAVEYGEAFLEVHGIPDGAVLLDI